MTTEAAKSNRRLHCWIESFEKYSEGLRSPAIFRKWAGIVAVAGALERRVWVRASGMDLYPSLYVVLVGPPGVGKTVAIVQTEMLWRKSEHLHVAPTSVTKASLLDTLAEATQKIVRMDRIPPYIEYHSLQIAAREFGVLLPAYEQDMMNHLNDIYDCGLEFEERRRGRKDRLIIKHPQLNIIAGTTPSFLGQFLPEGAWDQGFMARVIVVYSGEVQRKPLFDELTAADATDLIHDLKEIIKLYGRMSWTAEAAAAIQAWDQAGGPPAPEHRKLQHYATRRTLQIMKLCTISSASRGDSLIITIEDYRRALEWLIEAEVYMPDTFKAMTTGGDSAAIDECWYFIWEIYSREKKPVIEHRIVYFLQQKVPAHSIMKVLEIMVNSNIIEVVEFGEKGRNAYKPLSKK
jgi:hypothetical protein